MIQLITAAMFGIFIQNSILERALGLNILMYAAGKKRYVFGFTLGIIYITSVSAAISYKIDGLLGVTEAAGSVMPAYVSAVRPVLYMAAAGLVYIVSTILVWRFMPKTFSEIKHYVHLSALNSSVLGALYLCSSVSSGSSGSSVTQGGGILTYIGYGIGTGLGFLLAALLLYAAETRLNSKFIPPSFRGMPVTLVYISIVSLALYAFVGYSTILPH